MPAVVDKEQQRLIILDAFQSCLGEKPFDKITLRDIARKAEIPHPTVLTYFKNREAIVLAYVDYIADRSVREAIAWVQTHKAEEFDSKKEYVKRLFMNAVKLDVSAKQIYTGALNVYILAQYDARVSEKVHGVFVDWITTIQEMLLAELGLKKADPVLAAFMLNCLEGLCLNSYNGVFSAETFDSVLGLMADVFVEKCSK